MWAAVLALQSRLLPEILSLMAEADGPSSLKAKRVGTQTERLLCLIRSRPKTARGLHIPDTLTWQTTPPETDRSNKSAVAVDALTIMEQSASRQRTTKSTLRRVAPPLRSSSRPAGTKDAVQFLCAQACKIPPRLMAQLRVASLRHLANCCARARS